MLLMKVLEMRKRHSVLKFRLRKIVLILAERHENEQRQLAHTRHNGVHERFLWITFLSG